MVAISVKAGDLRALVVSPRLLTDTTIQTFLIDMLDSQPRQRLSDDQLRTILWVMRECGTPNVPSFSAIRKIQQSLTEKLGVLPRHHVSSQGNHFYMNHPAQLFSMVRSGHFHPSKC